jgi:DNA mismatch repair ATPase MutS
MRKQGILHKIGKTWRAGTAAAIVSTLLSLTFAFVERHLLPMPICSVPVSRFGENLERYISTQMVELWHGESQCTI